MGTAPPGRGAPHLEPAGVNLRSWGWGRLQSHVGMVCCSCCLKKSARGVLRLGWMVQWSLQTLIFFCPKPRDMRSGQQAGACLGRSSGEAVFVLLQEGFLLCLEPHGPLTVGWDSTPRNRAEAFEGGTGNVPSLEHRHVRKWMKGPGGRRGFGSPRPHGN